MGWYALPKRIACARRSVSGRCKRITEFAVVFKARETGLCFLCIYSLSLGERARVRGSDRTELHLAPGGIDSLRSPCGQPVRCALSLSNWLSPVVEPRSGVLIPPEVCNMRKKSPHFHASSSLKMAVRGGLTRCARPAGSLFATLPVCPTGCRQLSNPGRGFSPPFSENIKEKSPYFRTSSYLKYGGEGGIRTPVGDSHPPFRRI